MGCGVDVCRNDKIIQSIVKAGQAKRHNPGMNPNHLSSGVMAAARLKHSFHRNFGNVFPR
jgi:hypothetical protein